MTKKNCVYKFINKFNEIIYVGKAKVLDNRICIKGHKSKHLSYKCYDEIAVIQYKEFRTENDMDFAERYYIQKYRPKYNIKNVDKQITIKVDELERLFWSVYSIDEVEIQQQKYRFKKNEIVGLNDFQKHLKIKIDLNIFDFILFYTLNEGYYMEKHRTYREYEERNELHMLKKTFYNSKLEEEHKTYQNIDKLDKLLDIENQINLKVKKELDKIFEDYKLLSYKAIQIPQYINQSNECIITDNLYTLDKKFLSLYGFNACNIDIANNIFKMMIIVYPRYGSCKMMDSSTCKEVNKCKLREDRMIFKLVVECN